MNSIDFCFWLQGALEITDLKSLTEEELTIIKNHLNLVFLHEIDYLREKQTTATKVELNSTNQGNYQLLRCK